ncbi:acyloxyacyl hydrolase [Lutibacter sp. B1]|uniref:acyloxyacyl hydrolase n=1 Tax=Lutibacter sp. B1 TaxID=2725996 RepID=UPI0014575F81|nr:acyloxyacyl hydrolase [Lutibacter sp. B1]NLP58863.1 acyloxyacyl hydrolase [Lutibacter sp. B1]
MRKVIFTLLIFSFSICYSQSNSSYIQADYFYGNIYAQNPDANAFLLGHPQGFFISYNKRNFGEESWHEHYNYPDFGYSFGYQDYHSEVLGKLYSIYGHYNFYLLNRRSKNHLILRTGIGLAYSTNPYDKVTNNKNTALGTRLNSSTYFKLYYQRENIFKNIGVNAGLTFIHASNSNVKSPNSGVNVWALTLGLNYNLDEKINERELIPSPDSKKFTEPIKYNFAVRGGINESEIIGSGQKPFFVASVYADKRLNRKSAIQFGADLYISPMLKDYYEINKTIYRTDLRETDDFSRVGLFIGHELFINKISVETQIGYYVKYPFDYEGRVYETLGLKRYLNDKWFASVRLKAHAANAETVEFGVGIRI